MATMGYDQMPGEVKEKKKGQTAPVARFFVGAGTVAAGLAGLAFGVSQVKSHAEQSGANLQPRSGSPGHLPAALGSNVLFSVTGEPADSASIAAGFSSQVTVTYACPEGEQIHLVNPPMPTDHSQAVATATGATVECIGADGTVSSTPPTAVPYGNKDATNGQIVSLCSDVQGRPTATVTRQGPTIVIDLVCSRGTPEATASYPDYSK